MLSRDDEPPPNPPLEFVAAFHEDAADAAWELLEELGLVRRAPGSPWGN